MASKQTPEMAPDEAPARPQEGLPAAGDPSTDPWRDLRRFTSARLALGRAGRSLPTHELLQFGLAHAMARDAVHVALDTDDLARRLPGLELPSITVRSAAADRHQYLLRPDLGRRLSADSAEMLRSSLLGQPIAVTAVPTEADAFDLVLVVADGLSSMAAREHATPLINQILATAPAGWRLGPIVIATQARVALGDEIGELLKARLVAILIGERPGLSSPDSLGVYLTWAPKRGRRDAERNCISNIRPQGLDYVSAANRFWWLCGEARRLRLTGVDLKDRSDVAQLPDQVAQLPVQPGQAGYP